MLIRKAQNCTNCGAALKPSPRGGYFACDYCTTLHFHQETKDGVRLLGEPSAWKCPVCRLPLVTGLFEEEPVLTCTRCNGNLMRQRILGIIIQKYQRQANPFIRRTFSEDERRRQVPCPQCQNPMENHRYHGGADVLIDSCFHCRLVWLDPNELATILKK